MPALRREDPALCPQKVQSGPGCEVNIGDLIIPTSDMSDKYQPRYKWHRTKLDENDVPSDSDWSGYDDGIGIGRIQLQPHGPMKGKWLWSGHGPRGCKRPLPHQGYEAEGREAMRMVEEYYDSLLTLNGMKPLEK